MSLIHIIKGPLHSDRSTEAAQNRMKIKAVSLRTGMSLGSFLISTERSKFTSSPWTSLRTAVGRQVQHICSHTPVTMDIATSAKQNNISSQPASHILELQLDCVDNTRLCVSVK
ncbi:hypothetical protein J6590_004742 [Homalodisca vitripennis]|nr:hypothetical protein J6590_004742 [Homalodisca vitripennis]